MVDRSGGVLFVTTRATGLSAALERVPPALLTASTIVPLLNDPNSLMALANEAAEAGSRDGVRIDAGVVVSWVTRAPGGLEWAPVRYHRRELRSRDRRALMIFGSVGVASAT